MSLFRYFSDFKLYSLCLLFQKSSLMAVFCSVLLFTYYIYFALEKQVASYTARIQRTMFSWGLGFFKRNYYSFK